MKRSLDESEEAAAVNILALLPREIVLHMLEIGHLSIADVFIFCRTNVWSYQLCNDINVWNRIYNVRFSNLALRRRVDAILSGNPTEIIYRYEEITGILHFGPPISMGPVSASMNEVDDEDPINYIFEIRNEIISIVNQICGPPDENDITWSRDLGILTQLFRKMIVYKILDHDFLIDEPVGPIDRRIGKR